MRYSYTTPPTSATYTLSLHDALPILPHLGCGPELCWRQIPDVLAVPEAGGGYQLDTPNVHRDRIAGDVAGDQRAVPYLLGIQSAAARYQNVISNSSHPRHVSARSCRGFHIPGGDSVFVGKFPFAGAAQDFPLHSCNDV